MEQPITQENISSTERARQEGRKILGVSFTDVRNSTGFTVHSS